MAKKNKTIYWIIGIILGYIILQQQGFIGALLPPGSYNAYPDESVCTFLTNVDPATSSFDDFKGSDAWISLDMDDNKIKESFKYISVVRGTSLTMCSSAAKLIAENFNSAGDDIYYYFTGGRHRVYVCKYDKTEARYFNLDTELNVPTECTGCVDTSWTPDPSTVCDGETFTQTSNCGNTRTAIGTKNCAVCNTQADTNCDGTVSWNEINTAISNWLSGTYNWVDINTMISAWLE